MDGIKMNGVTLFLGYLPIRKSLCFYFEKGCSIYPVAYVSKKLEPKAIELWEEFVSGIKEEK
jgi:hypothetical protein